MIGFLQGEVIFSDGLEAIILTPSGVGHQVFYSGILSEGTDCALFICHVIKEDSQTLFGFQSIKEKKLFELLLKVKGVGPKSAFAIVTGLGVQGVIQAINLEDKKSLQKVPGIGAKAAAQLLLDLNEKIKVISAYSDNYTVKSQNMVPKKPNVVIEKIKEETLFDHMSNPIFDEAIMACKELGFKESDVIPLAEKIISHNNLKRADQLVHLVLREINV